MLEKDALAYTDSEFNTPVYQDVPRQLELWEKARIKLAIYSSATDGAQKLMFEFTNYGGLKKYFNGKYYDLKSAGNKRDSKSYFVIAKKEKLEPNDILFLSDIREELDAAKSAGFHTIQIVRPSFKHLSVASFDQISTI